MLKFTSADYAVTAIAVACVVGAAGYFIHMWVAYRFHRYCERRRSERAFRAMYAREKIARGEGHELLY